MMLSDFKQKRKIKKKDAVRSHLPIMDDFK